MEKYEFKRNTKLINYNKDNLIEKCTNRLSPFIKQVLSYFTDTVVR